MSLFYKRRQNSLSEKTDLGFRKSRAALLQRCVLRLSGLAGILACTAVFSGFPAFSENLSQVYLKGEHFFPHRTGSDLKMNYSSLYADWSEESRFRSVFFKVNGVTEFFLNKGGQFYFTFPEVFASYTYRFPADWLFQIQSFEVTLGRRVYSWNTADDYWDLGLWNPLSKWNPLTPFQNGLIGTFLDLKGLRWRFQLFAGGVYLPHQGIRVKLENQRNGKPAYFSSVSRWFTGVPRQVRTGNSLFDINYYKRKTSITSALFQESSSVSFKLWSGETANYWMRAGMGYKPVNEPFSIRNEHDAVRIPDEEGKDPHIQQVFAFFPVRQRLLSLEWGLDYKGFSLLFSVGDDHVFSDPAPEGWTFVREREDFSYLSGFLRYERSFSDRLKIFTGGSFISSRFSGADGRGRFPRRGRYKMTDGLGFDLGCKWKHSESIRGDASLQYWYSAPDKGGLLSLEGNFWLSEGFFTGAGVFLLGAEKKMKTFLNYFRANDYFFWKVGYVF